MSIASLPGRRILELELLLKFPEEHPVPVIFPLFFSVKLILLFKSEVEEKRRIEHTKFEARDM